MERSKIFIDSPNVKYTRDHIESNYKYQNTVVHRDGDRIIVKPVDVNIKIKTDLKVPKMGLMLVGWGGNNGSTLTAAILANKHRMKWNTRRGTEHSNWYGSIIQSSTVYLGMNSGKEPVFAPLYELLPIVNPDDIIIDGWDISSLDLAESMERAKVLDYDLQKQLRVYMRDMKPRPAIYNEDFIAANQISRADNILHGTIWEQMLQIQANIREFKETNNLDKVIIMWTANTERFADVTPNVNDTTEALLHSIKSNSKQISPSTLYAVAAIMEGCTFINGSPQNTFVPGCIKLAEQHKTFIAGDDFKSGQTKLKSVLVDFLISAGIKPVSIVSYNHLGNNDGKNLSSPQQFKSKEISKSNVVDDMVASNSILYEPGEKPDHCVVIKYVPYVGDSKRAMDEYTSEILMGGQNTLVIHNTCEDSLLAAPIILDLVLLAELCERITFKKISEHGSSYNTFHSVLSILSYMCKAPLVPEGTPVINSLFRQRACIENILKACLGLPPDNNMLLEHKVPEIFTDIQYNNVH